MQTIGVESSIASAIPVTRFVAPGPEVARQTPTLPVARVALRCVDGALLVARQDVVQPVGMVIQMIVDRNDLSAGITEDRIGSLGDERQQQRFRSLYFLLVSHKSIGFDGVGRPPAGGAVGGRRSSSDVRRSG